MRNWGRLLLGMLIVLGGVIASATPMEHHLYLHLVSPTEEGEQIRIIISADDVLPATTEETGTSEAGVLDLIQVAEVVNEPQEPTTAVRNVPLGMLLFIFVLAIFLGVELISKVPSQLHTPLMSGSNAISGITIVGAMAAAGFGLGGAVGTLLGTLAVIFATINVVGGYMVTNRMLGMFKKKVGGAQ